MMRMSLPVMQCEPNCGECCGPVLCHPHELKAVNDYAKANGIEPKSQGLTCPWYQDGTCKVYPVRPMICNLFGHSANLTCSRGHNTNIPPQLERRIVKQYGKPTRFLHDIIPGSLERFLRQEEFVKVVDIDSNQT